MNASLQYSRHPLIDIRLVTMADLAGKRWFANRSADDRQPMANSIAANDVQQPWRSVLTIVCARNTGLAAFNLITFSALGYS